MTITQAPPTAFPTHKHIEAAAKSISAADKKTLSKVRADIDALNNISGKFQAPRMNQIHPLDAEIHAAELKLTAEPTEANALAVHELIARKASLGNSGGTVALAIDRAVKTKITELEPVAIKIIDAAENAFDAEASKHRETEKEQRSAFTPQVSNFEARVEASKASFTEKRRWISNESAAAHFLFLELGLID